MDASGGRQTAGEALRIARSELTVRLEVVSNRDWGYPTPCGEWNVRQLVNHVVGLHHRVAGLLRGGSRKQYIETREDDWLGSDHMKAWYDGVRELDEAIAATADLDVTVAYRIPVAARDVIALTAFETAVHTWDISRALHIDEHLDDGLIEFSLRFMRWIRTQPDLAIAFDTPGIGLDGRAPPHAQLLHLAGRRP